jgi:hypothetical protein
MFKKGDKVVCINVDVMDCSSPNNVTLDKTYTVANDQVTDTNVNVIGDNGCIQGLFPERFKLREAAKATLDLSKPVETQDGRPVTLVLTDARGDFPLRGYIDDSEDMLSWTAEGKYYMSRPDYRDLRNVPPKPLEKTVYLNVYKDGDTLCAGSWNSRAEADSGMCSDRVACIKVNLVEGQFDE